MKTILAISCFIAACSLTGVQSQPGIGGSGDDGTGNSNSTDPRGSDVLVEDGSGNVSVTGSDYAANCNAPDGPVHPYVTVDQIEALVIGAWIHCSGPTLLHEQLGIELQGTGMYFQLGVDPRDVVYQLWGADEMGNWAVEQADPGALIYMMPDPNTSIGVSPTFEDSPRKFKFAVEGSQPSVYAIVR